MNEDFEDYQYDSYRDDLLTEDYDTLVTKYGKALADKKWDYCSKDDETESKPSLSTKQLELYDYIKKYINNQGHAPTIREIAYIFGKSLGTIHPMLKRLQKKGYIDFEERKSRTIKILK